MSHQMMEAYLREVKHMEPVAIYLCRVLRRWDGWLTVERTSANGKTSLARIEEERLPKSVEDVQEGSEFYWGTGRKSSSEKCTFLAYPQDIGVPQ